MQVVKFEFFFFFTVVLAEYFNIVDTETCMSCNTICTYKVAIYYTGISQKIWIWWKSNLFQKVKLSCILDLLHIK